VGRPAGGGEAGLEVLLESLHPGLVTMGVAEEGRVAVGHVLKMIARAGAPPPAKGGCQARIARPGAGQAWGEQLSGA
jgi:hypothetical protein